MFAAQLESAIEGAYLHQLDPLARDLWKAYDAGVLGDDEAQRLAELEAGLISERTKAALKAAKARGVKLGRHGAEVLAPKFKEEARQRAKALGPVIAEMKGEGLSLARMATELNKRKMPTPRGGRWDHSSVRNVVKRLAA